MLHQIGQFKNKAILKVLRKTDAFRRSERFQTVSNVYMVGKQGRLSLEATPYPQRGHWLALLEAADQVNVDKVVAECRAQGKVRLIIEHIDHTHLA